MNFDFLNKISFNRGSQIGLIIFGTIIGPFMFIFQFARPVFDNNGLIPLLLICLCVGLPICLLITALGIRDNLVLDPEEKDKLIDHRFSQMGSYSAIVGGAFYLPCIIKYFYASLNQSEAIKCVAYFLLSFIFSSIMSISRNSTKKLHDALIKESEKNKIIQKDQQNFSENDATDKDAI